MRATIAALLLLCLPLTGCLDTARIKRAPVHSSDAQNQQTNVPGVPFYVKVAQCKQETVWLQPYYTLVLKKTVTEKFADPDTAKKADEACESCRQACKDSAGGDACKKCKATAPRCEKAPLLSPPQVSIRTQVLSLEEFQDPTVQGLRELGNGSNGGSGGEMSIEPLWARIAALPPYSPFQQNEDELIKSKDVIELANKSTSEAVVDYARAYYYNTPRPWIGTSSVDAHLNTDGTLSEGNSSVTSQTVSTFLNALPISSLLTTAAGGVAATRFENPYEIKRTVEYALTIRQDGYTHTHSRYVPFQVPCPVDPDGVTQPPYALNIDSTASTLADQNGNKPSPGDGDSGKRGK